MQANAEVAALSTSISYRRLERSSGGWRRYAPADMRPPIRTCGTDTGDVNERPPLVLALPITEGLRQVRWQLKISLHPFSWCKEGAAASAI